MLKNRRVSVNHAFSLLIGTAPCPIGSARQSLFLGKPASSDQTIARKVTSNGDGDDDNTVHRRHRPKGVSTDQGPMANSKNCNK
jgi:hypothetical protein